MGQVSTTVLCRKGCSFEREGIASSGRTLLAVEVTVRFRTATTSRILRSQT